MFNAECYRRADKVVIDPQSGEISKIYNSVAPAFFLERQKTDSHFESFVWPVFRFYLGDIINKRVIDMGCGPGVVTQKLIDMGARTIGVDVSHSMLEIAHSNFEKRNGYKAVSSRFYLADARALPFPSESADLVVASYVLNHMGDEDLVATLKDAHRVLRHNGRFLIMDPHPDRNQRYYQAGGGTESKYRSGWYREGWPELGDNMIPVYYRHQEDWVNACQTAGFSQACFWSPTSNSHLIPNIPNEIKKHYASNRILIIDLVK